MIGRVQSTYQSRRPPRWPIPVRGAFARCERDAVLRKSFRDERFFMVRRRICRLLLWGDTMGVPEGSVHNKENTDPEALRQALYPFGV